MKVHCTHDKLVDISELTLNPKNRNVHPPEQIERLAKILEYQGWRYPVKVSKRSGFVTSGHGRIEAAKRNGWAQVPVNYQDYESEDQEYADLTADNAIASWAELDLSGINTDLLDLGPFDIDLLGIKDFVLEPAELIPQADEDSVPEYVEPKTKLGDIYQLGRHRLMCGDSTDIAAVEKLMDGETAELCFTSPPYADQREYNGGKELSTEHLATFIRAAFNSVKYFAVNLGYSRKDGEVVPYWDDYINEAKNLNLKVLSWNVWDRGHAFSIGQMTAMFPIEHEWIFVFGKSAKDLNLTVENKTGGTVNNHRGTRQADGKVVKQKDMQIRSHRPIGTIVRQPPQMGRDGFDHPARFPVDLPEKYIEAMTDANDAVYEPFSGSGTTFIAAEKTGRRCFGMELDPHYCDVIVARWEKYTGQKAELLSGEVI